MRNTDHPHPSTTAIADHALLYVSLELALKTWLVTSLSPGSTKMARRAVSGGDLPALLDLIAPLKAKAARDDKPVKLVVIQEVGMDGFWIHRALSKEGIESWLVDPASVAVSRRRRRAKTDKIDGEALVRVLMAFKRGEPRVCAMAVPPSPEEEDRRRVGRERRTLVHARVEETNRIKGLLFTQGIRGYQPLDKSRREKLKALRTGDGRPLPPCLLQEIIRGLDRLELILTQIAATEAARTVLAEAAGDRAAVNLLPQIRGIGPCLANVIWSEALYRSFENRRQIAAYAGLAPTPFKSGDIDQEQGISKSGNGRLRVAMVELAWLWIQWQPNSALTKWFLTRAGGQRGRVRRVLVVALARKLRGLTSLVGCGAGEPMARLAQKKRRSAEWFRQLRAAPRARGNVVSRETRQPDMS